jgi:hypothetical protein
MIVLVGARGTGKKIAVVLAAAIVAALTATSSPREADGQATYSGPKVITRGGTYSGNWQSTDPDRPAVEVKTSAPVVLENCSVRGKEDLIETMVKGARLTVRDCHGYGINPGVAGRVKGRFVYAKYPASLKVEHNYLEGTTGIKIYDWTHGASGETLKVRYNKAKNIDGRKSAGSGYSTDKVSGYTVGAQFLMVHSVHDVPGVEVAWNWVTEVPNQSRVGDTINFFGSGGNSSHPYLVHDNFIDGAFPINPRSGTGTYSGGGIITDGQNVTKETAEQYLHIYNNQVLDSLNYGVKITQGHHNRLYGNVVVRDGVLSDGTVYASSSFVGDLSKGAGVALWNAQNQSFFGYHKVHDNAAGWYDPRYYDRNQRNFNITSACSSCVVSGNTAPFANPLSDNEKAERQRWQEKLALNRVHLGPRTVG